MDEVQTRPSGVYAKTHCDLYLGGRGRRGSRTSLIRCQHWLEPNVYRDIGLSFLMRVRHWAGREGFSCLRATSCVRFLLQPHHEVFSGFLNSPKSFQKIITP